MQLPKIKNYTGQDLTECKVFVKVDGIQAISTEEGPVSRSGKPLRNLPEFQGIVEVFTGSWGDTSSRVRSFDSERITEDHLYSLYPETDRRLYVGEWETLREDQVKRILEAALSNCYEGLVIQSNQGWYKVKPVHSIDLEVTGWVNGSGMNSDRIGALITERGRVSAGLTHEMREMKDSLIGKVIEIEYMEETVHGKLRHPRLLRIRWDK